MTGSNFEEVDCCIQSGTNRFCLSPLVYNFSDCSFEDIKVLGRVALYPSRDFGYDFYTQRLSDSLFLRSVRPKLKLWAKRLSLNLKCVCLSSVF